MMNPFETPKYLEYYRLREAPYTTNPDERYLYLTDKHQEAIAMIAHVIENKEGAGLVVGEQGTGKTTIMRRIATLMNDSDNFRVAIVETAEHSPTLFQLVKEILESFGMDCVGRDTKTRIEQLKQFLLDNYKAQIVTVLLIDEAQQMQAKLLESLRGFLNFEDPRSGGKLLQIVLFAMPTINRRLAFAPSFRNRLIKTELERMSFEDMKHMLTWRFEQSGGKQLPFDNDALQTLHSVSHGNPRTICGIAQLSLEYAALKRQPITTEVIQIVTEKRYV